MLTDKRLVDAPAVNCWSWLKILAVVVPKPSEKIPEALLYARGYAAESDDDEILLLKLVQSVDARKPDCRPDACAT